MRRALLILPVIGIAAGCQSRVDVRKVEPGDTTTPGIRYSLPKVVLQVAPGVDGTMQVTKHYLPDLDNTYAIDADTTLGKHTFNVELSKGLLTKVTYNADTTAVAEKVADLGGTIAQKIVDKQIADDAADKKADKDAAAALKTKRDTLVGNLESATKVVRSQQARIESMKANGSSNDAIRDATVTLAVNQSDLNFAQEQLLAFDAAHPGVVSSTGVPGGNVIKKQPAGAPAPAGTPPPAPPPAAPPAPPPTPPNPVAGPMPPTNPPGKTTEAPPAPAVVAPKCPPDGATPCKKGEVRGPMFIAVDERNGCPLSPPTLTPIEYRNGDCGVPCSPQPCFCSPKPPESGPADADPPKIRLTSADGTGSQVTLPSLGAIRSARDQVRAANTRRQVLLDLKAAKEPITDAQLAAALSDIANATTLHKLALDSRSLELVASQPLSRITGATLKSASPTAPKPTVFLKDSLHVVVDFATLPAAADYTLDVEFQYEVAKDGLVSPKDDSATVKFQIVVVPDDLKTP